MIANILMGLAYISDIILNLISLIVIASIAMSWFHVDPYNPYVQMIRRFTEPMYRPFRKWTRKISGPIDFSPMIIMMIIVILQKTIPGYFMTLAHQIK